MRYTRSAWKWTIPASISDGIQDDGNCQGGGCIDPTKANWDEFALYDDGSCIDCNWAIGGTGYSGTPFATSVVNETVS